MRKARQLAALTLLSMSLATHGTLHASALDPAAAGGLQELDEQLARLQVHRRLLVIGAHPDDEDTSLLTFVARGLAGEAAYFSLTRGEGGQNLLGEELGEGLGLLRTGELVAARSIDGARQYFSRAYDFGYTRSLDETLQRWDREELLRDAVRVVRRFRPQVVVSIFPPTAAAGHGQHQAAGVIAEDVVAAAGDARRFPELGAAWTPSIFYRAAWFRPEAADVVLPTGALEPYSGRSYHQIAMSSRSQHRSQDMGMLQDSGPRQTQVTWVEGAPHEGNLFGALDTSLGGIADLVGDEEAQRQLRFHLEAVQQLTAATRRDLTPVALETARPALEHVLTRLQEARASLPEASPASVGALLDEKIEIAEQALQIASRLVLDATTERALLTPGETLRVELTAYNGGALPVAVLPDLLLPRGWRLAGPAPDRREVPALDAATWEVDLAVAADAEPTVPYFLDLPRQGDLYDWSAADEAVRGLPLQPPLLQVELHVESPGAAYTIVREVVARARDQKRGEVRTPLRVVPPVEVFALPELAVLPLASTESKSLQVSVVGRRGEPTSGEIRLRMPEGWKTPPAQRFELRERDQVQSFAFAIDRPSGGGEGTVAIDVAAVLADGTSVAVGLPALHYEHIRPVARRVPATVDLRLVDLELPPLERIAYVKGASDSVADRLLEIGLPIELYTAADLARLEPAQLDRFDTILLGSRAYEADPQLAEVNQALLGYVRRGGRMVVQYQQYDFSRGGMAPLPLEIARPHDRITDEASPVTVLQPEHPVFHSPNEIGERDWQGWVQERGLYFAHTWDPGYEPLLELVDPEMEPQRGGLLVARLGEGTYVYTGLAFFRQLPAAVPGALRLLVNLLAI